MDKRVLVLGATGLLGKYVAKEFREKGFKVRVLARNESRAKEIFNEDIEIIQGDVLNQSDLKKAIIDCDCIHISLSKIDEKLAVEGILKAVKDSSVKEISYVSGVTVCKENAWFDMINMKYQSEGMIKNSGLNYCILRPTWFFESIDLFIQNGKAMTIGKQKNPYHWIAAKDFAKMIVTAYQKEDAKNKTFYIHGPESMLMKDVISKYCQVFHPKIKKVSEIPFGIMNLIGFLTGKRQVKMITKLSKYFSKVPEMGDPAEANKILGSPNTTFEQWMKTKKSEV